MDVEVTGQVGQALPHAFAQAAQAEIEADQQALVALLALARTELGQQLVQVGRPGQQGLIPSEWISRSVGGNSIQANLFASVAGAFMYFATLTEVPILEGLIGGGMGKGPALALLLAGPALSLPNMLVIRSIMGTKKTVVFVMLVVVMAAVSGTFYGAVF